QYLKVVADVEFQSTHSRGVRQPTVVQLTSAVASISIHALTRSATDIFDSFFLFICISIHALTRSATRFNVYGYVNYKDFNPRTHEECDHFTFVCFTFIFISIHALTRSATLNI